MIRNAGTKALALERNARYEPIRAVTLIPRLLAKTLFGGRSDEVVFWALVYAHYSGGDLSPTTEKQLDGFAPFDAASERGNRARIYLMISRAGES